MVIRFITEHKIYQVPGPDGGAGLVWGVELQQGRDLLSASELEERTGIPTATWRYWAHIGGGPPSVKVGRRRLYKWSEVQAWVDRG